MGATGIQNPESRYPVDPAEAWEVSGGEYHKGGGGEERDEKGLCLFVKYKKTDNSGVIFKPYYHRELSN